MNWTQWVSLRKQRRSRTASSTAARNQLRGQAARESRLAGLQPSGQEDTPQLQLDIDHAKASALRSSVADINDTLAIPWGGSYVNDFIDRGRVKRVYLQCDAPSRMVPEDIAKWPVRNASGQMLPFSRCIAMASAATSSCSMPSARSRARSKA